MVPVGEASNIQELPQHVQLGTRVAVIQQLPHRDQVDERAVRLLMYKINRQDNETYYYVLVVSEYYVHLENRQKVEAMA